MTSLGNISIRALLIFIDVCETQEFLCGSSGRIYSASQVSRVIHQMEGMLRCSSFFTAIPGR